MISLVCCAQANRVEALDVEGLFRLSGDLKAIASIKPKVDRSKLDMSTRESAHSVISSSGYQRR